MVEENKLSIEERVTNIEKIIRENFNDLGSKVAKIDARPAETSPNGGVIYLYCGHCKRLLANITEKKPADVNYCCQCGTKIELDETFKEAVEEIKHAKTIYNRVHPLLEQVSELTKKVGKK